MNKIVTENPELPYSLNIEYNLDIALLNRMTGNYNTAIDKLESMSLTLSDIQNESEQEFIEGWLCKIQAEKAASEGLISIDEFMLAIQDCEISMTTKSSEIFNESDSEIYDDTTNKGVLPIKSAFEITPNPNHGSFKIILTKPCNNCEFKIISSIGQTIQHVTSTDIGSSELNVNGLTTGHYKIICLLNNKIIVLGTL